MAASPSAAAAAANDERQIIAFSLPTWGQQQPPVATGSVQSNEDEEEDYEDYLLDAPASPEMTIEAKLGIDQSSGRDAPTGPTMSEKSEMEVKDHLQRQDALMSEEPKMVKPISTCAPVVAPEEVQRRPLTSSVIVGKSKLSFQYDPANNTVTKFKHDVDEVMSPTDDELRLLPQPALLKGWDVEHRERFGRTTHGDKYYTHPLRRGQKLKSVRQVEEYLRTTNFENISITFRDAVKRARRSSSEKRQCTLEELEMRKSYVERYLKNAWDNLMNRSDSPPI